jgi:hypothetical protein
MPRTRPGASILHCDHAAIPKDDAVVLAQVTNSVFISIRMFVVGAGVPTVAWGIAALEFDRSHTTKRSLASATMYALLVVSLYCFALPDGACREHS